MTRRSISSFRWFFVPTALVGLLVLGGCSDDAGSTAERSTDPDVLARWVQGGDVHVLRHQDVDDLLLDLPKSGRFPSFGESTPDWLRRHLESTIERRVMLAEGEPEDEAWETRLERLERDALVAEYLARENADFDVTLGDAKAEFEERPDRYARPEQRSFRNLLVGVDPDAGPEELDAACERAEALRIEVLGGASFEMLVMRHSDSSNAASGGAVVGVRREQLRGEVGDLVFSLEPGEPSQPLRTPAGCHLFYVVNVVPESTGDFELVRDLLVERIAERRRREWLIGILRTESDRQGVDLPQWFGEGLPEDLDEDSVLIERGDDQITVETLRSGMRPNASAFEVLLEKTTQLLLPEALERDDPAAAERIRQRTREEATHRFWIDEHAAAFLAQLGEEDLRPIYEREKERFQSDPEAELTLYSWPIGPGDPLRSLEAPRRLAAALESSADAEAAWEPFAGKAGAQRQAVPQTSLRRLMGQQILIPVLQRPEIAEGDVIGPYRVGPRVFVAKVETFIPSRQLSFLEVRGPLVTRWQEENADAVETERRRVLEEEHEMQLWDDRIESFGSSLLERLDSST